MFRKILIWIGAFAIAVVAGLAALGSITKSKAPELSTSLPFSNGYAFEALSSGLVKTYLVENDGRFPDKSAKSWRSLAVRAFEAEPITPAAIVVLALGEEGDVQRELMQHSISLSRRQQLVHGWMVADGGSREDVVSILSSYDTMMRIKPSSGSVILPVVSKAVANDMFLEPLSEILEANPPWAIGFWQNVSTTSESITNGAKLRRMLFKPDEDRSFYLDSNMIEGLVRERKYPEAFSYYELLSATPEKNTNIIHNGDFSSLSQFPPLDWRLTTDGEYGATIDDGMLNISAVSNSGGLFARQLVRLPAAMLKLNVQFNQIVPDGVQLYLQLTCAEEIDGRLQAIKIPLNRVSVSKTISNNEDYCKFYWLDILGKSAQNEGFDIGLKLVSIRRN